MFEFFKAQYNSGLRLFTVSLLEENSVVISDLEKKALGYYYLVDGVWSSTIFHVDLRVIHGEGISAVPSGSWSLESLLKRFYQENRRTWNVEVYSTYVVFEDDSEGSELYFIVNFDNTQMADVVTQSPIENFVNFQVSCDGISYDLGIMPKEYADELKKLMKEDFGNRPQLKEYASPKGNTVTLDPTKISAIIVVDVSDVEHELPFGIFTTDMIISQVAESLGTIFIDLSDSSPWHVQITKEGLEEVKWLHNPEDGIWLISDSEDLEGYN